jgi:hypothetical protein
MFTSPSQSLHTSLDNGVILKQVSLNDLFNIFTSQASQAAIDLVDLKKTPDLSGLSSIVLDSLSAPMKTMIQYYMELSVASAVKLPLQIYIITLIPIFLVDLMIILILLFIFSTTSKDSMNMYKLFLDIPKVDSLQKITG